MPTFEISDKAVIRMGTAAAPNTPTDVQAYFKTLKPSETVGNEDVTTIGTVVDGAKVLAYLLNEMSFSADVLYDAAFWKRNGDIIKGRKIVALEIYPKGIGSGLEKWALNVLVGNRDRVFGVSEVDKGTLALTRSGPCVESVQP
jgi:hypothetical protein